MWSTDSRVRLVPALFAVAALGACASNLPMSSPVGSAVPLTPTEQYSIEVRQSADQLALAPHANGLSDSQRDAVAAFAGRWRENGRAPIAIRTPSDAEPRAVERIVSDLMGSLQAQGVPPEQLRREPYEGGAPGGPVLASFIRHEAMAPNCESGWSNLTSTGDNRPMTHFGCANTANLAAMIADPRDLVRPAAITPGDAGRRQTVIEAYRGGKITSSERDSQAVGTISSVVK